jgi:hypothetical protein
MKRIVTALALGTLIAWSAPAVLGFCGFYVAKADTRLFNRASQVVLVRDGDRTVLTMANDFQGSLKEFAVVVPVPTFLRREQIHVGDRALVEHLDAYSAPRLVEYFDSNPCLTYDRAVPMMAAPAGRGGAMMARQDAAERSRGVTVEAKYTVGEYDILILSAQQSSGLEMWLRENGYRIPAGASEVLGSYLKQNMRFFVAKVNLTEQAKLGYTFLRPLQVAYESPKFMLPIRLGMVNADGTQELFVYALTRRGRVETTNYRTVRLPTGMELPTYLKSSTEFGAFYNAMFTHQVGKQDGRAVFLEHAWDTKWCDPCAADPLTGDEMRRLGVFWDDGGQAPNVFMTRLHVRYDKAHFPEDLVFQETADRTNFQGRYVVRHAWTGDTPCEAATGYRRGVAERREMEAQRLSELTGWTVPDIRKKMGLAPGVQAEPAAWWDRIWKR